MKYIKSNFHVEDVNLQKLAKKFDTPLYCYSYEKLKKTLSILNSILENQTH